MTTNRIPSDYYTSDEFIYRNNKIRTIPHENYSHVLSNNTGVITNKTKNGSYNIVEKDFGDYKVIYHIPIEYGDDYDISQLEDIPIVPEQQSNDSPRLVRRRIYQQYNDVDYDNDYEYVEEIPVVSPRRRVYVSPRRQEDREVVQRIYEQRPPPTQTVEYIYEDDHSDPYAHRQENEEVEYIVRERVPKQIVRLNIYIQSCTISIIVKYLYRLYSLLFFSISVYGRTPTCSTYSVCRRSFCTSFITATSSSSSTFPSFTASFSLSTISSSNFQSENVFTNFYQTSSS
jgi:hypothetical protein